LGVTGRIKEQIRESCKIITPQAVRQKTKTEEVEKRQHARAQNLYKFLIKKKALGTETWNRGDEKKIFSNVLRSDDMG